MPISVVMGAFQFVGFHLAKYLLDHGEEVIGVDWVETSKELVIDKELEIGRNSNFSYIPIQRLESISNENSKSVYVSCYDLCKDPLDEKQPIIHKMITFLNKNQGNEKLQMIILFPIQEENPIYQPLLKVIEEIDEAKLLLLPTIYGPWQPESMSFEAAIRQKSLSDIERALKSEDKKDALFISDLIRAIVKIGCINEKKIHLQSEAMDQWQQCAKLLWKDEFLIPYLESIPPRSIEGIPLKVENKTAPMEGISLQKKHFQQLQLMKKWENHE